ncbi:hypothetical protein ACPUER_12100 [Burkholderia sp. DN3021]|uniref:hypothetical protein n=1 Tax=Burkholderia sp. DN3021 TaxID=3410137 RepID=UPI003C7C3FFC
MKRNQDTYWAIVRAAEPVSDYCPAVGTFRGGPSGTSAAPHLYLSEAKARARCGKEWKVVPVKLVVEGDAVVLSVADHESMLKDQEFLEALKSAGVDNWEGYDYALEALREESE